jgi:hypothetical protein
VCVTFVPGSAKCNELRGFLGLPTLTGRQAVTTTDRILEAALAEEEADGQ